MHYLKILIASILIASAGCTNPPSNSLTTLKANPMAPDFILQDIDGRQHAFSDYRGKVVVINFWATWCPPCISEMPSLERASVKLAKQGIPILGIDVGEDRETVMQFLNTTPVSFTVLLDIKSEVLGSWAVPSLPTTLVINQEGKMALLAVGEREWDSPAILQQIISLQKTD
jgi:thiol-disulfide isomerase/thioredoxin